MILYASVIGESRFVFGGVIRWSNVHFVDHAQRNSQDLLNGQTTSRDAAGGLPFSSLGDVDRVPTASCTCDTGISQEDVSGPRTRAVL